jgi:hypothetical protein
MGYSVLNDMIIYNDELQKMWKVSWPILRHYTSICLQGLKKSSARTTVSGQRFEPGTSLVRSRSATHLIAKFGKICIEITHKLYAVKYLSHVGSP